MFLKDYWNKKIDEGLAKHGTVDVLVSSDYQIDIARERGVVIDDKLITKYRDGYRMTTAQVFTIAGPTHV